MSDSLPPREDVASLPELCESPKPWYQQGPLCLLGKPCEYGGSTLVFPGGSGGKASAYNAGDPGSIPGSGGSPGEGNGDPLQYSCLENPLDRGNW